MNGSHCKIDITFTVLPLITCVHPVTTLPKQWPTSYHAPTQTAKPYGMNWMPISSNISSANRSLQNTMTFSNMASFKAVPIQFHQTRPSQSRSSSKHFGQSNPVWVGNNCTTAALLHSGFPYTTRAIRISTACTTILNVLPLSGRQY